MIIVFFIDVVSVIAHDRPSVVHARFANSALAPTTYKRRVSFFDAANNTLAFACYKGEAHMFIVCARKKNMSAFRKTSYNNTERLKYGRLKSDTAGVAVGFSSAGLQPF